MTIPTRLFIEPIPGSALYEAEKVFKANIHVQLRQYIDAQLCAALGPQDAKRSALRGGPCVALTQPLPRALVKSEQSSRFGWSKGLLATIYRHWVVRQAHEQYFQTCLGCPR